MTVFVLFILPGTPPFFLLPPETPFILFSPDQTHFAQGSVLTVSTLSNSCWLFFGAVYCLLITLNIPAGMLNCFIMGIQRDLNIRLSMWYAQN